MNVINHPQTALVRLLNRFATGEDRSQAFVCSIGDFLSEQLTPGSDLPADLYEELEVATACFSPGGGQFMYDEAQLEAIVASALERLKTT